MVAITVENGDARDIGRWRRRIAALAVLLLAWLPLTAGAEDGYELWLRYRPLPADYAATLRPLLVARLGVSAGNPTLTVAASELDRGLAGLLGQAPSVVERLTHDGTLLLGTRETLPREVSRGLDVDALGPEGYAIRRVRVAGHDALAIVGGSETGALYGSFELLRRMQMQTPLVALEREDRPRLRLRLLNHWDNLDRHVERGYAGESLWNWHLLPDWLDPRYTDYARANASIGINATVLNNVNANAQVLTAPYLRKVAALAGVFRPYGIRVFLSARFSAPMEIGGLDTADPLDPRVRAWWGVKADEIYAQVPDFGGFLVKANSEGQPGPQDFGRSHADGANMLADALARHDGFVMWRAFVYSHEQPDDRAKQAYTEFVPLDGRFRENVLVQVKNGAIDFQPREPFHPLFGAMPKTPLAMEFQITKEYLGFATHLAYLGPLFEETLRADTQRGGADATVARVIDGSLHGHTLTAMAGVANLGSARNWSGSHFDQANWYAFGRFAWNPRASSREIADEWVRMTFGNEPALVEPIVAMMMDSREAVVDYMTPLGLHHLMGRGHHYGPGPWVEGGPRADWTSVYYHRADAEGIGFDRSARGSDAVSQYAAPIAAQFGDPKRVPESLLLWFHHLPWDWRMASGRTLWDELVVHYDRGVAAVTRMRTTWARLAPHVDAERHAQIATFLAIQQREAQWWRDASLAYFRTFSRRPLPEGHAEPPQSLEYYQSLEFPHAPGNG